MDIAGHVSKQMLARYSHIRLEAKRAALDAISTKPDSRSLAAVVETGEQQSEDRWAQNWAQSLSGEEVIDSEVVDLIGSSGRIRTYNPSVNSYVS
jgi:hypothetical protein